MTREMRYVFASLNTVVIVEVTRFQPWYTTLHYRSSSVLRTHSCSLLEFHQSFFSLSLLLLIFDDHEVFTSKYIDSIHLKEGNMAFTSHMIRKLVLATFVCSMQLASESHFTIKSTANDACNFLECFCVIFRVLVLFLFSLSPIVAAVVIVV